MQKIIPHIYSNRKTVNTKYCLHTKESWNKPDALECLYDMFVFIVFWICVMYSTVDKSTVCLSVYRVYQWTRHRQSEHLCGGLYRQDGASG